MTIKKKSPDGKVIVTCTSLAATQKPGVFVASFMSPDELTQVILQVSDPTKFLVGSDYELTVV